VCSSDLNSNTDSGIPFRGLNLDLLEVSKC